MLMNDANAEKSIRQVHCINNAKSLSIVYLYSDHSGKSERLQFRIFPSFFSPHIIRLFESFYDSDGFPSGFMILEGICDDFVRVYLTT